MNMQVLMHLVGLGIALLWYQASLGTSGQATPT